MTAGLRITSAGAFIRTWARRGLAELLWPLVRPVRRRIERSRSGAPLLPGITAVVAARDEAYTIGMCLRSLVGFADQIVCVDNGSSDGTLARMEEFRRELARQVEVDVVSLPGALLGECRQTGLALTRRQWHLRWDADMVAKDSGPEDIAGLRERILRDERPRAIQLPRTNLFGDLRHTLRHMAVSDPGEPILMRFNSGIRYREYGRFDAVRLPLYYAQVREPAHYYVHLAGLKSVANLLHRFHYFNWRQLMNETPDCDPELRTFEGFKSRRNRELFGTEDPRSLKFRYLKQLSYLLGPYDPARYGDYPRIVQEEMSRPPRFEVLYKEGRPWLRVDHADAEMADYRPTEEDLAWDAAAFLRRFLTPAQCSELGITAGEHDARG